MTKKQGPPVFLLGTTGVIVSLIFFPIGIIILFIGVIKYLADWMCYNFDYPRPLCYIAALVLGPFFLPFVIISFLYEAVSGSDKYSLRRQPSSSKKKEVSTSSSKKKEVSTSSSKRK